MKGLLACPARQLPQVFELVKQSHAAQTTQPDRFLYQTPGESTDYTPCMGASDSKFSDESIRALAAWKDGVLRIAREGKFDWLLITDSDVLLHPSTIADLLAADMSVVSACYWTFANWDGSGVEDWWPNAMPYHDRETRTWKPWKTALHRPGLHPVGLTGACLMLRGQAFDLIDPWTPNGGWGEDQWFARTCLERGIHQWTLNMGQESPFHIYEPVLLTEAWVVRSNWDPRSHIAPAPPARRDVPMYP